MPAARKSASLKKVLAYRNPAVVERFRGDYPVSKKAADAIWLDALRWLWLAGTYPQALVVGESMTVIDEMWHAFMLFSADYTAFCDEHFGRYLHHAPTTHANFLELRARVKADAASVARETETQRRAQYELVVRELGLETLERWYVEYAKTYSPSVLLRLRREGLRAAAMHSIRA
jgi:hypothetical protein